MHMLVRYSGWGILYKDMQDAVREGDGLRVLHCWQFLLPIFRASKQTTHSIEVFALHQFALSLSITVTVVTVHEHPWFTGEEYCM